MILEVVERDVDGQVIRLLHATDQARRDAWGVALDDVGAEAASLALLPFLCPDVVKLDMALLSEQPTAAAARITATVRAYAERTGAAILAEGIETPRHAQLASILGATYGQGFLYGRPGPLPRSVPLVVHPVPLRQHPVPITRTTPFQVLSATLPIQRARQEDLAHIFTHVRATGQNVDDPGVFLTVLESEAQYQQLKSSYECAAEHNAFTVCLVANGRSRRSESRFHVEPLAAGASLGRDLAMIVIRPYYAAALVARPSTRPGTRTSGGEPTEFDYIYTHDRTIVINAGRALLSHLQPDPITSANSYSQ